MKDSLEQSVSKLNADPLTQDLVKLVRTKTWGPAWSIDGVVVVTDPRVTKSIIRADAIPPTVSNFLKAC